jgi:hypothetical protein
MLVADRGGGPRRLLILHAYPTCSVRHQTKMPKISSRKVKAVRPASLPTWEIPIETNADLVVRDALVVEWT